MTVTMRTRSDVDETGSERCDLAIIGFGFSGLATLANLTTAGRPLAIAIIADDPSGLGLAYSTRQPRHLLNVVSRKMGAWACDHGDFLAWLQTGAGERACQRLGVAVPGPDDFAPRALFGAYLADLRRRVEDEAHERGMRIEWVGARAESLRRGPGGWDIEVAGRSLQAHTVVLATGNEQRPVSESVTHLGSGDLERRPPADTGDPAVLIGTGLTAVDALLSLRSVGFTGPVIAASRTGLLPRAHHRDVPELTLDTDAAASLDRVSKIVRFLRSPSPAGDWRASVDALRPHTGAIWQRLSEREQRSVARRWSTWWGVHRHRMAPENAAVIESELADSRLRVMGVGSVHPATAADGTPEVTLTLRDGSRQRVRAAAIVDCTGSQLDLRRSEQPLLRELVTGGIVTPHHTGLGLAADADFRVADGLYAIGSLLVGQLWESIAVPELRDQAAIIADAVLAEQRELTRGRVTSYA
jgi:uncharacterized NAD(P)/FAD-binding protein YdhS